MKHHLTFKKNLSETPLLAMWVNLDMIWRECGYLCMYYLAALLHGSFHSSNWCISISLMIWFSGEFRFECGLTVAMWSKYPINSPYPNPWRRVSHRTEIAASWRTGSQNSTALWDLGRAVNSWTHVRGHGCWPSAIHHVLQQTDRAKGFKGPIKIIAQLFTHDTVERSPDCLVRSVWGNMRV